MLPDIATQCPDANWRSYARPKITPHPCAFGKRSLYSHHGKGDLNHGRKRSPQLDVVGGAPDAGARRAAASPDFPAAAGLAAAASAGSRRSTCSRPSDEVLILVALPGVDPAAGRGRHRGRRAGDLGRARPAAGTAHRHHPSPRAAAGPLRAADRAAAGPLRAAGAAASPNGCLVVRLRQGAAPRAQP